MSSTNIYIHTHKDFEPAVHNQNYKILSSCDVLSDKGLDVIYTNNGENINELSVCYSEVSGMYWLWKNIEQLPDFVGMCHYRKYFSFLDVIPEIKSDEILIWEGKLDCSVEFQYKNAHNILDLKKCIDIVRIKYPDYEDAIEYTLHDNVLYMGNMFIMSRKKFIEYTNWLFDILFEYDREMGFKKYDDVKHFVDSNHVFYDKHNYMIEYQYRIQGFLSERLFTIWVNKNFNKDHIKHSDVIVTVNHNDYVIK